MKKIKSPLISIVILNYNGYKYLQQTIPAVLNLEYKNKEIIVVDNASTDDSIKYLSRFQNIKIIKNKENFGTSKGRNIGVKNSKGKYMLMIDNDIFIKNKDILEKLMNFIQRQKKESIITVPTKDINKDKIKNYGNFTSLLKIGKQKKYVSTEKLAQKKHFQVVNGGSGLLFFKKNIWQKLGGFDESQPFNLDDYDLGIRTWIYGFQWISYSKIYVDHLGIQERKDNKKWAWKYKYMYSGSMRVILKNFLVKNILLTLPGLHIFYILKTFKQCIYRKSLLPLFAFLYSIGFFIKNLPDTIKQRKIIQSKRIIKDDIFLYIKPPQF